MSEGGFLQDGGGSANNSQQNDRQVSFRSLTIKQLQECRETSPDSKVFEIDGAPVHHVRIVGIIRKIEPLETSINYDIQDATGELSAKQWTSRMNEDNDTTITRDDLDFKEGDYVAMFLTIRSFQNRSMFNAIRVDPKISLGFVMLHQLSVLQEHCYYTNTKVGTSDATAKAGNDNAASLFQPENTGNSELDLKNKIVNLLRGSAESLHSDYIARELGRDKYTIETVMDGMLNEGEVYDDAGSWALS